MAAHDFATKEIVAGLPWVRVGHRRNGATMPNDIRIWHHVIITTYGSWLPGDPRGFRTRASPRARNRRLQESTATGHVCRPRAAQPRVACPTTNRTAAGMAAAHWAGYLARPDARGAWLLAIAVAAQHTHLLVKLPRGQQRRLTGLASGNRRWICASAAGKENFGECGARASGSAIGRIR